MEASPERTPGVWVQVPESETKVEMLSAPEAVGSMPDEGIAEQSLVIG